DILPDAVHVVILRKVTPVEIPSRESSPVPSETAQSVAPLEAASEAASEVTALEAGSTNTAATKRQNQIIEKQ
ncbi:hypothetical protein FS749_012771, partial [Ceratobasidium sp. UAMH 11750]